MLQSSLRLQTRITAEIKTITSTYYFIQQALLYTLKTSKVVWKRSLLAIISPIVHRIILLKLYMLTILRKTSACDVKCSHRYVTTVRTFVRSIQQVPTPLRVRKRVSPFLTFLKGFWFQAAVVNVIEYFTLNMALCVREPYIICCDREIITFCEKKIGQCVKRRLEITNNIRNIDSSNSWWTFHTTSSGPKLSIACTIQNKHIFL